MVEESDIAQIVRELIAAQGHRLASLTYEGGDVSLSLEFETRAAAPPLPLTGHLLGPAPPPPQDWESRRV